MNKILQLKNQIEICSQQISNNSHQCQQRYEQLKQQAANDWHDFKKLAPLFCGAAFVVSLIMTSSKRWRHGFAWLNKSIVSTMAKSRLWIQALKATKHFLT